MTENGAVRPHSLPAEDPEQGGGIRIGDVAGGITQSVIAGRDVHVHKESTLRVLLGVLKDIVTRHRRPLLAFTGLGGAIVGVYLGLGRLPLIVPIWPFLLCLALLAVAAGSWEAWRSGSRRVAVKTLAILSSVLLVAALAGSIWWVMWPRGLRKEAFVILVAHLGEGPEYLPSREGRQIARGLREKIEDTVAGQEGLAQVQVREVGIARGRSQARWIGEWWNADLVIWGQVIVGSERGVTVRFEVTESESTLNPAYPSVLPIGYELFEEKEVPSEDYFRIKETLAGQSNAVAFFVVGLAHHRERNFDQARVSLEKAREELIGEAPKVDGPDSSATSPGLIHYYLGTSYQWLGHKEKAVQELTRAAEINPLDPAAQVGLALNYRNMERIDQAREAAQRAIDIGREIDPERRSKEVQYDMGLAYEVLEEYDSALRMYLRVQEIAPDFAIAYVSAARLYARQGKYDRAIEMQNQAIEKAEQAGHNGAWSHLDLAFIYRDLGDTERALQEYQTAIRLEPQQDWMHFQLALFYEDQGQIDAAWKEYDQVVAVSANKAWAYGELGRFLSKQGFTDDAIRAYLEAVDFNPREGALFLSLARIYAERHMSPQQREGDAQNALKAFQSALQAFPEDAPARFYVYAHRGRLYYFMQSFDLALADLQSALAIHPSSAETQFSLALTLDALGDGEGACQAYTRVLAPELQASEQLAAYAGERAALLCSQPR